MTIVVNPIPRTLLYDLAKEQFGDMVKAVVDIEKETMAIGGELHADEEAALLERGSSQKNLWGINLYLDLSPEEWIEFDSMINIRPSQGNRSRGIESEPLRKRIKAMVGRLILEP